MPKYTQDTELVPGAIFEYVEVVDPADSNTIYRVNKTAFSSHYGCLFGNGCPGLGSVEQVDHPNGCCTHGVYFESDDDLNRVNHYIMQLTDEDWDQKLRKAALKAGGPIVYLNGYDNNHRDKDDNYRAKTRVHEGFCIFSNRGTNGFGCAFHAYALRVGMNFTETKPFVCSEVPIKYMRDEEGGITNISLDLRSVTDWQVKDEDMRYWCVDDPNAYEHDDTAWVNLKNELVFLIGERAYDLISEALRSTLPKAMPAERRFLPIVEVT